VTLLKIALAVVSVEGCGILRKHKGFHVTIREHKASHSETLMHENPCVTKIIINLHRPYLHLFSGLPPHETGLPNVSTSSL
jgi:hypothetical protein